MSAQDTGRDVANTITTTPEAEQENAIRDAVKDAYGDFKDPKEFNDFLKGMTEGFGNNNALLNDLQLVNSQGFKDGDGVSDDVAKQASATADNANKLNALYSLNDNDGLFDVLDAYHQTQDDGDFVRSDWNPFYDDKDGKIGVTDLERFLEDAKSGRDDTVASNYLRGLSSEQQENVKKTVESLINTDLDNGISKDTIDDVGNSLGFDNPSSDEQRRQFQTYFGVDENNPGNHAAGTEVISEYENGGVYAFTDQNGNRSEVGINRLPNGEINAFNMKNASGVEEQYKMTDQGWMKYDSNGENGQPWNGETPQFRMEDGKPVFEWYEKDPANPNDPGAFIKRGFEGNGNQIDLPVRLNGRNPDGTPVAVPGQNRVPTGEIGANYNIGDLPVTNHEGYGKLNPEPDTASAQAANVHPEYTIENGTNLTEIARKLLKESGRSEDQQAVDHVIRQLADYNKIADINMINADAQLKVPVDIQL